MSDPRHYLCPRTPRSPVLSGKGDDPVWSAAPWTDDFIDIEGAPPAAPLPRFRTRCRMLWDATAFYLHAELEEPHVWGTFTDRNSIIYLDNDFELFLDPDADRLDYYELEINALNTVMELHLDKPYIDGGKYTFITTPGIRSAVHIDGTLNDPSDTDRGWSLEFALPWAGLSQHPIRGLRPAGPSKGDRYRINFSRVQWTHRVKDGTYEKVPRAEKNEDNWVWSPQGVIDMHRPEKWGVLEFGE